jgi:hypothetical protein
VTSAYPSPDRSGYKPGQSRDVKDIGWGEGVLVDGRPYRAECWAEGGVTVLTFFFSTRTLEDADKEALTSLLVQSGVVSFVGEDRFGGCATMVDGSGNEMWSVNVVIGDEDRLYARSAVELQPYDGGNRAG